MQFCTKWENVQITGFQIYKWNELLMRNNISKNNAIFVLRRHPDFHIKRILQVNLQTLVEARPSLSTGNFQVQVDYSAFATALFRSGLFWIESPDYERVVRDLTAYARSSFEFSGYTINCSNAPRLVFVLDFSYTPVLHVGCPPQPPLFPFQIDPWVCAEPHDLPGIALSERAEDNALRVVRPYESDSEDDEVDSAEPLQEEDADDVERRYPDETMQLATALRRYRNVGRTHRLVPLSGTVPVGLSDVPRPMMWPSPVRASGRCRFCMGEMKAGDVIVGTRCEHFFHRDCAFSWITQLHTCPLCATSTPRRI